MSSKPAANDHSGSSGTQVQGEGDYKSNRSYVKSVESFVQSGKVDEAARNAKPASAQEAEAMRRAEKEGASHAKGDAANTSGPPTGKSR